MSSILPARGGQSKGDLDQSTRTQNPSLADLSEEHRRMLLEESGISLDVAAKRGYYTARTRAEVPEAFAGYQRRPGLVAPMLSADGKTLGWQIRPDNPRKDKGRKPLKYETPDGSSPVVDVHPRMLQEVRSGSGPLLITEGCKTGDAATSRGIATLVLAGVDMWSVPKAKPKRLRGCFDHVRLRGRPVFVAFDSDCMTKENVQRALAELVEALGERGAVVKVIYLPFAADGSKQGIDDYLVACGTVEEMFTSARDFSPADVAEIRLSRDDELRAAVRYLRRRWHDGDWMTFVGAGNKGNWQRGHTARDTMETLIRLGSKTGKWDGRGLVVEVGLRRLAEEAAKSAPSVGHAVKHLQADGQLEILPATEDGKARRYRLLVPSAALYSMESGRAEGTESGESDPRCKGLRCPSASRLHWASPIRSGHLVRRVEGLTGRTVAQAVGENVFVDPDYRPYGRRLGPHRGAALDVLEAVGGGMHLKDLCEALHRKRPWDVRRRILIPLEEAGIIEREGDFIMLAVEWVARLDRRREEDGEVEQAERQAKRHRADRERYRMHLERKKHGTPRASTEAVRRTRALRDRRLREIREAEELDLAPTPPAVERLVGRIMGQHEKMRLGLLCEVASGEGLRWRDVPPAVRRMGFRVERLPEFGDREFVFAGSGAA